VLDAGPQQLLTLLDLFLVSARDGERYELHEPVGRFAAHQQAGRPEERARALARHAAYFAEFVHERAPALRRSRQAAAEIERERPNILAAWEWAAAQGHVDLLERMRPGLLLFHQLTASPLRPAAGVESALRTPRPPQVWPALPAPGGGAVLGTWELATVAP
jgi:hypothetical protein